MLILLNDKQLNEAVIKTAKQMNLDLKGVRFNRYRDFAGEFLLNAMSIKGHQVVIESSFSDDFGDSDWMDGHPSDFGDR